VRKSGGINATRVLFTSPILEHPPAGGPQLRIENTIKALSRACDLYVVARRTRQQVGGDAGEAFYRQLCTEFTCAPSSKGSISNQYWRKLQSLRLKLSGSAVARQATFLLDFADRREIDIIWFGFGNVSFPLMRMIKKMRPSMRMVCDTDSVWSRYVLRELPYETDARRRSEIQRNGRAKEQEEQAWVNLCEITTAVSEVDAEYYRSIACEPSRVRLFSNAIDLDSYRTPPDAPADLRNPCIYLAGTFGYTSMDTAARWMLDEVLPKVKEQLPEITLYLVGRDSDRSFGDISGSGVAVKGKLPTVLPYLCHADVAVVPLKFESGTRFKILEAGACGVPIVSTTLGAEGIPVTHGTDILIADDPDDFAGAIVKLVRDRAFARRLADRCRSLVRGQFSVETLVSEATEILNALSWLSPAQVAQRRI
jgi:polysaccharide biosynthesis protein PslH